jgi:hypothetical protein
VFPGAFCDVYAVPPVLLLCRKGKKGTKHVEVLVASLSLLSATSLALDVPVDDLGPWTLLTYNKIEPNEVAIVENGLRIRCVARQVR